MNFDDYSRLSFNGSCNCGDEISKSHRISTWIYDLPVKGAAAANGPSTMIEDNHAARSPLLRVWRGIKKSLYCTRRFDFQ